VIQIIGPDDHSTAARKRLLQDLELLVDKGFLKNNCELVMPLADWIAPFHGRPLGRRYLQAIYSMNNLEKLDIMEYDVTFADLANLFQSCPNIIHLRLKLVGQDSFDSEEDLSRNQLQLGFQKLHHFEIAGYILHSGELFLEIFPYVQYYKFNKRRNDLQTNYLLTGG
jgi:predicted nuclease of predicted toxin-antitoxin system